MKKGDIARILSVSDTPYSERLIGKCGTVEGISPDTVDLRTDEGYLISIPPRYVEPAGGIGQLNMLFRWIDDWCCSCSLIDEETCISCIIRYLSMWAEEQRSKI